MAARSGPPPVAPATVIRGVAVIDIALGVAIAVFGESVVPMGEIAKGVPLLWVVGGLLALSGVGALVIASVLDRRRRAATDDAGPVTRD